MEDYKPNSHKYKEEQRQLLMNDDHKVEKVVTGKVRIKKESGITKFFRGFISEDAKDIKSFVFGDVLIPAMKKAISDIVTDGIDIILYGESGRGSKRRTMVDKVSYNKIYYDRGREPYRGNTYNYYSYDNFELESRGEAEEVLARMDELMAAYGLVKVADLKDLIGMPQDNYMDNKYGWTNITTACVIRTRNGYTIKMPKAMPID